MGGRSSGGSTDGGSAYILVGHPRVPVPPSWHLFIFLLFHELVVSRRRVLFLSKIFLNTPFFGFPYSVFPWTHALPPEVPSCCCMVPCPNKLFAADRSEWHFRCMPPKCLIWHECFLAQTYFQSSFISVALRLIGSIPTLTFCWTLNYSWSLADIA